MKLQDVIHFYIGSNAMIGKKSQNDGGVDLIGKILGYDTKAQGTVTCIYYDHGVQKDCIVPTSIKLILRPLSSMTDEEMEAVVLIRYSCKNTLYKVSLLPNGIEFKTNGFTGEGTISFAQLSAEQFAYLLSRPIPFDLFNLIESGQAISAK